MKITTLAKRAIEMGEQLDNLDLIARLDDLQVEVEDERDNVEPYENRNELTQSQEERQYKLDNLANAIDDIKYQLEELRDRLLDIESEIE